MEAWGWGAVANTLRHWRACGKVLLRSPESLTGDQESRLGRRRRAARTVALSCWDGREKVSGLPCPVRPKTDVREQREPLGLNRCTLPRMVPVTARLL